MNQYHLQPYQRPQSRYHCPQCSHRSKTFTRYISIETGEELADHVGRCDREDSCGYHLSPYNYLRESGLLYKPLTIAQIKKAGHTKRRKTATAKPKADDVEYYIHSNYVNDSFVNYDQNNFVQYLISRFGLDTADQLVGRYRIGTSSYWHGATVFWQLDTNGFVRTGKIMLYDKQSGKRVKQPFNHITWAHTLILRNAEGQMRNGSNENNSAIDIPTSEFKLKQCLFGEHLLITSPYKPVAIVESEKTAIIASAMMPAFIWLASGSLDGLNIEKCRVLQNRQVMLYPDINAYTKWKKKAFELRRALPGTTFAISNELERMATEYDQKISTDLGDVLV